MHSNSHCLRLVALLLLGCALCGGNASEGPQSTPGKTRADRVSLRVGETRVFDFSPHTVLSISQSQERLLSYSLAGSVLEVRAADYGASSLTIFLSNHDIVVVRVEVTPVNVQQADLAPITISGEGSLGHLGTQLGFQSANGFFDRLTQQEEFFSYQNQEKSDSGLSTQSAFVRLLRPLQSPPPRPDRLVETVEVAWDSPGKFRLVAGDTDLSHAGWRQRGLVRGARLDVQATGATSLLPPGRSFVVLGATRGRAGHFLWGESPSAIAGAGRDFALGKTLALTVEGLVFEKNTALGIAMGGAEGKAKLSFDLNAASGWFRQADLTLVTDAKGRLGADLSALFAQRPVHLSVSGSKRPENHAVVSEPTRFQGASENYAAVLGISDAAGEKSVSASASRGVQFVTVDQIPGRTTSDALGISASLRAFEALGLGVGLQKYRTEFSALGTPFVFGEEGNRVEGSAEWAYSDVSAWRASLEFADIQSPGRGIGYENAAAFLGWRRGESERVKSGWQWGGLIEAGYSRYRFKEFSDAPGEYFVSRLSPYLRHRRLEWEGLVQSELRVAGVGDSHTLRLQSSLKYSPWVQHRLGVSLFRQFDWMRRVYRDLEGAELSYIYSFGSKAETEDMLAPFRSKRVSGRVLLDDTAPVAGAVLRLKHPSGELLQETVSDAAGVFQLTPEARGDYLVELMLPSAWRDAKVLSQNPRLLAVPRRAGSAELVFSLTRAAQIETLVFGDVSGDGKLGNDEVPLVGAEVECALADPAANSGGLTWQVAEERQDRHLCLAKTPGRYLVRVNPARLPAGYRVDDLLEHSVLVRASGFAQVEVGVKPERSIAGRVFVDKNSNRRFDAGDMPRDGAAVQFGPYRTTTGEGGQFIFRHLPVMKGRVQAKGGQSETVELGPSPLSVKDIWVPLRAGP